ncbi:MAG: AAA family ATPase [Gaiellales bacterium]
MNPFQYQRPLPARDVINRDDEALAILALCDSGQLIRLDAPRRYGKTSLVGKVFAEAEKSGGIGVLVDLDGVLSVQDVADRVELAYRELPGAVARRLRSIISGMEVSVGAGPARVRRRGTGEPPSQRKLLELLDLPHRIAERGEGRVIVAFDEFQEILKIDGMDGTIRSRIQHHSDFASYIFTGSQPRLMNELFGERRRPFWDQARPMAIGRLDSADIAEYVTARFEHTGRAPGRALSLLLVTAAGHPQRAMLLSSYLWEATPEHGEADESTWERAFGAAMDDLAIGFDAEWRSTDTNQQRVLRAVAQYDGQPYRADAMEAVGIKRGSVARAIHTLEGAAAVERIGGGRFVFTDPLYSAWVAQQPRTVRIDLSRARQLTEAEMDEARVVTEDHG